ncbi:MAG: hypothetical protein KA797_06960 [Chitinophagales bacterium]|nr:hypothetical protein [Chitinophagales bacterium]
MKKEIKEELESIAPNLAMMPKLVEQRGALPAGYFEHFQSRVMHQVRELDALKPKAVPSVHPIESMWNRIIQSIFSPKLALAYMSALIIGISMLFFSNERNTVFAFDAAEVQAYIATNDVQVEDEWLDKQANVDLQDYIQYDQASIDEYLTDNQEEQI